MKSFWKAIKKVLFPSARRTVASIFLLLAVLLILSEVLCRFVIGLGSPVLYRTDPDYSYIPVENQELRRFHNFVRINGFGMRSDKFNPNLVPEGTIRVMFTGDSYLFGTTLLDQEEIPTEQFRKELEKVNGGAPVEVLNACAGSWGIGNCLAYVKKHGVFGSQFLVLVINAGDLYQLKSSSHWVGRHPSAPVRKPVLATSELVFRYVLPRLVATYRRPPVREVTADEVVSTFVEYVKVGQAAGARVLLVFVGASRWDSKPENERRLSQLRAGAEELGVAVLVVVPTGLSTDEAFRGGHPRAEFAKQIGKDIARFVASRLVAGDFRATSGKDVGPRDERSRLRLSNEEPDRLSADSFLSPLSPKEEHERVGK